MMRILTLLTLTLFTFSLMAFDAEARRMGGGKSFGKQRESLNLNKQQAAPKPQQPGQSATGAAGAAGAAAGGSKWLGPLAGLAAGGLLAALFMGGAFDGINFMDILVLIALAAGIFFVIRMLRRSAGGQASRPMQYSSAGAGGAAGSVLSPKPEMPASSSSPIGAAAASGAASGDTFEVPADFDVDAFLMHAKRSFIGLQAANDKGDLEEIRAYTTPELFAELNKQIQEEGPVAQQTEVVFVEASLVDMTTEGNQAIASVRFSGQLRDAPDAQAESFDEIWHVQKDLDDSRAAWLLAGIQQVSDMKH